MNTINGMPIVWDSEADNKFFGSVFPESDNLNSNKSFNEISNERALQTPFGNNSMFYKGNREVINGKVLIAPDIAWRYILVHDYDATKLINEFREENIKLKNSEGKYDDEIDFIVYAEKDDITISLGRVLLIKMSDSIVKYYVENKNPSNFIKDLASSIYKQQKEKNTFHFTEEEIADAFLDSIKLQTKGLTDVSILDVENFLKNITENISTFLHEDSKFTREQWDPTLKSDNYLFDKPERAVNYFVNKCDDAINEFKQFKIKLETIKSFNIIGFDFNTPYVADLIKTIDEKIQSIEEFKNWLLENREDIKLKIPYICGVWNGMIEFVAGIMDIAFFALNFLVGQVLEDDINLESLSLRESIEEILEKVLKNPSKIVTEAIEAIKNYKYTRYKDPKLNKYQLQYNEGEDTILAIDLIITIVTIIKGITKLSKQLPKFTKWIDEVLERRRKRKVFNNFERLENAWKKGWSKEKILEILKGEKPLPEEYLKKGYIVEHYNLFQKEEIASRIVLKETFEKRGIGKPDIGKTEFVSRKSDVDEILMLSREDQAKKLGIPIEQVEKGQLVRIDFKLSREVKIEIPSGNEWGANSEWIPGGILPDGNLEAIIKTEGLIENRHYIVKYLK